MRKNSKIKITSGGTRKFYWTEKTDAEEIIAVEKKNSTDKTEKRQTELKEADLYPLLMEFLLSELNIYSRRIDEKRSSNRRGENGNKWLHPDIVGLEYSGQNWHNAVKEIAGKFFHETVNLSAYEVKPKLNSSNLREAFFQAVSNSSWANYGYLVAAEIDDKIDPELRLLSNLHGIGIILLDTENPTESQYIIESAERDIDWDTVDRIAKENADFMDYIICVRETIDIGRIKKADWYRFHP
ncbi:MAG: HrgA protein [Candidatus Tokpelaia sp.]|nr:MAG: HrgA protein [Candidatus Tokpelaia sp.]KAA6207061.1 MAG: HrgA protein [Candidatus Tokpelaia sp.]